MAVTDDEYHIRPIIKEFSMEQTPRPLYGELVINVPEENESTSRREIEAQQDQVWQMINEAAYYLAEKRGFKPGYELQDWLEAEKQVKKTR